MALGLHDAGFRHLALVEWDSFAAETLRQNSKRVLGMSPKLVYECDASHIDYTIFADKVDLLAGGPPCQPFSNAGRSKGAADSRDTFPILLEAVASVRPKAVLIENVKGLLRNKFDDYVGYILKRLEFPLAKPLDSESWKSHYQRLMQFNRDDFELDEQYTLNLQLIDTADYGVPQRRERVIITASRRDLNLPSFYLAPTHSKEALLVSQWITGQYWEKHSVEPYSNLGIKEQRLLAKLRDGLETRRLNHSLFPKLDPLSLVPWQTVRDAIGDLPEPVSRGEAEIIHNHIQHPGARVYKGHVGSFLDYPAKALKAGTHGTPGGENMLRINRDDSTVRYFTTREAARLQTFPDVWRFHGTWGACIKQLGNAVPVKVAQLFATEIRKRLLMANTPNQIGQG